ncbi:MAG: response regulator transcription factor [Coriobacteriia bacterium]
MGASSATYLLGGLFGNRLGRFFHSGLIRWSAATATSAGLAVVVLAVKCNLPLAVTVLGESFLFGVGLALLVLMQGEAYSRVEPRQACFYTAGSIFLAAVLYLGIIGMPAGAALILTLLLPFVWAWLLSTDSRQSPKPAYGTAKNPERNLLPIPLRLAVATSTYGLAYGMMPRLGIALEASAIDASLRLSLVGVACAAVVIAVGIRVVAAGLDLRFVFKSTLLVATAAFLAFPLINPSNEVYASAGVLAGTVCLLMIIWTSLSGISHRSRASAASVFGWGSFFLNIWIFAGSFLGRAFADTDSLAARTVYIVSTVVVYAVLAASVVLFGEDDVFGARRARRSAVADELQSDSRSSSCEDLAKRHQLSSREAEILALLATGRDNPYIAQDLHIAYSTTKTYVKRIYAKLDVHSRQELLSLIDRGNE